MFDFLGSENDILCETEKADQRIYKEEAVWSFRDVSIVFSFFLIVY